MDTAELAMLPRLPDTRPELTTIAKVLNVDPAKALYLGKAANEQNVETMDLSRFRGHRRRLARARGEIERIR